MPFWLVAYESFDCTLNTHSLLCTRNLHQSNIYKGVDMLYVGYIVVIYRYQAFSFSLSSRNTKLKCSIRPHPSFNSLWILAIPADSAGCLKWIWDHYLPSNLNVSLQRSCQGLLPSVLPSFKLTKAGYEPVCYRLNNTRKHISQKELIEIRKNLSSGVDWANIEQDTAIYKL